MLTLMSSLEFKVIYPGENTIDELEAYGCWLTTWTHAFKELGLSSIVNSDDWTRQHEIGALFEGDMCVGCFLLRIVDLDYVIARQDSYFSAWSFEDMNALRRDGDTVLVSSYFTVRPSCRGRGVKQELMTRMVERFHSPSFDFCAAMTGCLRVNKGGNKLVKNYGFETIRTGAVSHGTEVELMALYRGKKS